MAKDKEQIIVEERLEAPSGISPMLFVGLGGCGSKIVARISKQLQKHPDYEEKYKKLTKFAVVDTNINDLELFRQDVDDCFLISDFEKAQYASLASGKDFLEPDTYFTQWVPDNYRFRAGDVAGAGQIRIESRLGCYYQMKHRDFIPRFRKLIDELKDHDLGHRRLMGGDIKIVICYSVAGGTGSGAHLSVAYALADQARQVGRCVTFGCAVLPSVFEKYTKENKDGTYANGYAALKETEHLMKLGSPETAWYPKDGVRFHYDPSDNTKTTVYDKPFEFLYIIDKPKSMTIDNPVFAAADGLFLQFFSPLFGEQAGDYDNYTQHQRFLVPHDFEEKGIQGYTSFFGTFGAAVLLVPTSGLVKYCAKAASLSLIRRSFLGEPPAQKVYKNITEEQFTTVREGDEERSRQLSLADVRQKDDPAKRGQLLDRLFQKRIRLLANAEMKDDPNSSSRFSRAFYHGHVTGTRPSSCGNTFAPSRDEIIRKKDSKSFEDEKLRHSLGHKLISDFFGEDTVKDNVSNSWTLGESNLLAGIQTSLEETANSKTFGGFEEKQTNKTTMRSYLASVVDELKGEAFALLIEGTDDSIGTKRITDGMKFFKEDAVGVEMIGLRYAAVSVIEMIGFLKDELDSLIEEAKGDTIETKASGEEEEKGGFLSGGSKFEDEDYKRELGTLRDLAVEHAMTAARGELAKRIKGEILVSLKQYAHLLRAGEDAFPKLEERQNNILRDLIEQGGETANRYVLDVEAFQITNGRRVWDFYYADQLADSDKFNLNDSHISEIFNQTFVGNSTSEAGGEQKLKDLMERLEEHLGGILVTEIEGNPKAEEEHVRQGLTLARALELELIYRSIYESNEEEINQSGPGKVRELVTQYRYGSKDNHIKISGKIHRDYLINKLKRTTEKAQYLSIFDDSKDMAGVRPNKVSLACCSKDFAKSAVMDQIKKGGDTGIKWLKDNWDNPREAVIYQAVLNVPLYCFGRMDEYRNFYLRFKGRKKQSKSLHVDKNWEDTLLDLDPQAAVTEHQRRVVRQEIANFTALLETKLPTRNGTEMPIIVQEDGEFFLRVDPILPESKRDPHIEERTSLGNSIMDAVQKLPEVFEADSRLLDYRLMLSHINKGRIPEVVTRIVARPKEWKETRDQLRNNYGKNTEDPAQRKRLDDFDQAQELLHEALIDLLKKLRDIKVELDTNKDGSTTSGPFDAHETADRVRKCIEVLEQHETTWAAYENPDEADNVSIKSGTLEKLLFGTVTRPETQTKNLKPTE